MSNQNQLLNKNELNEKLQHMAEEIIKITPDHKNLAFIGIRTRGVIIAKRLRNIVEKMLNIQFPTGVLDISLYRDDLSTLANQPIIGVTDIPFDINGKKVILVDDVLYTGRTIRAALDAIVDFGRPKAIILAALVDRGLREYPIQPDITGLKVETKENQTIQVRLEEIDGDEGVILLTLNE